jgi:2'-hydroxyisoflavone reductase
MHVLVLGGTVFLGRHVVEASVRAGHDVTLFNRGKTRPELFPELEKLRGDRDGDLGALVGRSFDAVVDTSGYVPRVVGAAVDVLGDVGHYTFVSTMSVYTESARAAGAREDDEVMTLEQETEEDIDESYGPLKAVCEDVVRERFANAFVPRPGLIVGPWDPTGRFTYWPTRFAAGGYVLAPNPPDAPVQLIDARDLANWIVEAAEQDRSGTYNAISPPMTMVDVLDTCRRVAGASAELEWVDGEFLVEQQVGPWMELPLWVGPEEGNFMRASAERALANGLRIRPLEKTVVDTLDWVRSGEAPKDPPAGLAREKEQRVLDAWRPNQADSQ